MSVKTGFWSAVFLDVPYVFDSVWRKAEFRANRSGDLALTAPGDFHLRQLAGTPLFALFALLSIYFCFGPTFENLCTVFGASGFALIRRLFGWGVGLGAAVLLISLWHRALLGLSKRYGRVFPHEKPPGATLRIWTARVIVLAGALLLVGPLGFLAVYQFHKGPTCLQSPHAPAASIQILVTLACIVGGFMVLRHRGATRALRRFIELASILLIAGIVLWIFVAPFMYGSVGEVLRTPCRYLLNQQEASGGPYANSFAVVVLAMIITTLAAYYLAELCFSHWSPVMIAKFRRRLGTVQLLTNDRHDPKLNHVRRWAALMNGIAYHPLHILLPASIGALLSPAQWMWPLALGFMLVSIFFVGR